MGRQGPLVYVQKSVPREWFWLTEVEEAGEGQERNGTERMKRNGWMEVGREGMQARQPHYTTNTCRLQRIVRHICLHSIRQPVPGRHASKSPTIPWQQRGGEGWDQGRCRDVRAMGLAEASILRFPHPLRPIPRRPWLSRLPLSAPPFAGAAATSRSPPQRLRQPHLLPAASHPSQVRESIPHPPLPPCISPLVFVSLVPGLPSHPSDTPADSHRHPPLLQLSAATGGISETAAAANVAKSIMGAGCFALPWAFAQSGTVFTTVYMTAAAALCIYCLTFMQRARDVALKARPEMATMMSSYAGLATATMGPTGGRFTEATVLVCCFGICSAYMVFVAATLATILQPPILANAMSQVVAVPPITLLFPTSPLAFLPAFLAFLPAAFSPSPSCPHLPHSPSGLCRPLLKTLARSAMPQLCRFA